MENEEMGFYMPEEGTNMWVDCMVIPANAQNPKLAHEFINYLLDYDIAYTNSEWVGYTSPHKDVLTDLSSMGGYFEGNEAYVGITDYAQSELGEIVFVDFNVYPTMNPNTEFGSIEAVKTAFQSVVEKAVNEKLKGKGAPKDGAGKGDSFDAQLRQAFGLK